MALFQVYLVGGGVQRGGGYHFVTLVVSDPPPRVLLLALESGCTFCAQNVKPLEGSISTFGPFTSIHINVESQFESILFD